VTYPEAKAEKQMLQNVLGGFEHRDLNQMNLQPVISVDEVLQARQMMRQVRIEEDLVDYLLALVSASRQQPELLLGASPRSAVGWLRAAQAQAWLTDRDFVTPDDIKLMALPLLQHRLILKPEAQLDGVSVEQVIQNLLARIPVPR
jgi:MoxR-like ATPase